jgi:DNA-binding NarL/FixJ family response regulator
VVTPHRSRAEHRILIIDDHLLFAQAIELALCIEGFDVTRADVPAKPTSARPLITSILRLQPDVVLLDLELGNLGDGIVFIEPAIQAHADVIVVTGSEDLDRWADAVAAGARKVLSKNTPLSDVIATVRRVTSGLPVMGREERDELMEHLARRRASNQDMWSRLDTLTVREGEVLGEIMQGHTVKDIAEHAFVSVATVRTQVKSILGKLEVSSQLAAAGLAHQLGWRPPYQRQLKS